MKYKDLIFLSLLRKNGREQLTKMSKITGLPVSTLYEKLKRFSKNIIKKNTIILDFKKLGFQIHAMILLRVDSRDLIALCDFLKKSFYVNNVYKISNKFNIMIEVIFRDLSELDSFLVNIGIKYKIYDSEILFIVNNIVTENFLGEPNLIRFV